MNKEKTRIFIADDHTMMREGLKQILEDTPDLVVADEASAPQEVLSKIWRNTYDLVLLDISFPKGSGLDVLKQLKCMTPHLPVLILTVHAEEQYAIRCLRAGASGYLTKESAPQELIEAIRKITQGKKHITASLAERLAYELLTDSQKELHEELSDREYQIMCMISSGKRVKDIASSLSLSEKTVSTHRARILQKMNMQTNAQLTHYAIKNNLVD